MLFVKDGPNPEANQLLLELVLYGKSNCNIVILEGILNLKWYKDLLDIITEVCLHKELSLNEIVDIIYRHVIK
jgi:hypothetical protein